MNPFAYERARDVEAAVAAVANDRGAAFLAGGTTAVDLMKLGAWTPARLVDLRHLPEAFRAIEVGPNGEVGIGAGASNTSVAYHPHLRRQFRALPESILAGASPALRNAATVGGNLLQRTRCYYFREPSLPCNKRTPGTGCPAAALGGFSRPLAIFGTSEHCIATYPGDMAVALVALDAVVKTRRPDGGERRLPVFELYRTPGDAPERDTVLEHGELILGIELPVRPGSALSHYLKVRDRLSYAFALVSCAAALELSADRRTVTDVRLAFGGVGTRPWRAFAAEEVLRGRPLDDAILDAAAEAAVAGARTTAQNAFKVPLVRRTLRRTLRYLENLSVAP